MRLPSTSTVSGGGKYLNAVKIVFINLLILAVLLTLTEIALRTFRPTSLGLWGHTTSPNGQMYGWGYYPEEIIFIPDPDSGEVYGSAANSHGWRDVEHQYQNSKGAFRILVLGDSITFGAAVSAENTYPRVLEELLQKQGFNVEVISIAYAGWGTDQELEALVNEGIKYQPNLVIVQFCKNDLTDNDYYKLALKDQLPERLGLKPFYYTLEAGSLVRHANSNFGRDKSMSLWSIVERFELPKLVYAGYRALKLREDPIPNQKKNESVVEATRFAVSNNQLRMIELNTSIDPKGSFYGFLKNKIDETILGAELMRRLQQSDVKNNSNVILRILEKRLFHKAWSDDFWLAKRQEDTSYEWQLYKALIQKMKNVSDGIGAKFVVMPETEIGEFEWELAWYRTENTEKNKNNYLSHLHVIEDLMTEIGVSVIQPHRKYLRARNDPHPNVEGNKAMAEDIMDFILRTNSGQILRDKT
jgi:lysophospholipase L1-like esterase